MKKQENPATKAIQEIVEANKCKKNKNQNHSFTIKYKKYNYCEFCGDCQALGHFPISEDLLEHLKEEQGVSRKVKE